ncbi:YqjK-like family protein [Dickeya chrysanthemi]|uniref:YqjK-like family protein n=1 Tax=Dickeya chrysanthemi TaxID=556 RepID=UPI003018AAC3
MNRRQRLAAEKGQLLSRIQQQRLTLVAEKKRWLEITAPCDEYWRKWAHIRRYLPLLAPAVAIVGLRHPRRLVRFVRKAASVWSAVKLIRATLSPASRQPR